MTYRMRPFAGGLVYSAPWTDEALRWLRIGGDGAVEPATGDPEDAAARLGELNLQRDELIGRLLDAGIDADRPACPALSAQLKRIADGQAVDRILCNLLDDEPPLRPGAWLGAAFAGSMLGAMAALGRSTGAKAMTIVFDDAAPAWAARPVREAARAHRIERIELPCRYPQSDAALLVPAATGRPLRRGATPIDRGVLLLDGPAAWRIGQCLLHGSAMETPVAVYDHVAERLHAAIAPVGLRASALLGALGIPADGIIAAGEALRGLWIDPSSPIGAQAAKLHLLPVRASAPSACIRCGRCIDQCPAQVQPAGLLEAAQQGDPELALRYGVDSCLLCGACDAVCPSLLPLTAAIRTLRANGCPFRSTIPSVH